MKNATEAISATKTSPAVAISHFGMCISQSLDGSDDRSVVFKTRRNSSETSRNRLRPDTDNFASNAE